MDLINMKEDKNETDCQPCFGPTDGPLYPYGLQISIDDDEITKLGITELPAVGEVIVLEAKVKVTRVSDEQTFHGRNRCLGLQITDMALGSAAAAPAEKRDSEY